MSTFLTPLTREHFYRHDSSETSNSSGSQLITPTDEEALHPIDIVFHGETGELDTPRPHLISQDTKQCSQDQTPRVRSLSKAFTIAKNVARTLTKTSRIKKVNPESTEIMSLPTVASIRSYDIYNMPVELPRIERKDRPAQGKPAVSPVENVHSASNESGKSLFSLPNIGIGTCSLENNVSSAREGHVDSVWASDKRGKTSLSLSATRLEEHSADPAIFYSREGVRSRLSEYGGTLLTPTDTGIERYSVEVNPSTSDDERDIGEGTALSEAATHEDISSELKSDIVPPNFEVGQDQTAFLPSDCLSIESLEDLTWKWPEVEITPRNVLILLIKIVCFIPWCIAVGGAIVTAPTRLEVVAFAPGYQSSLRGVHRFAHWANCAVHHVGIFVASVGMLWWWCRPLGVAVFAGVLAGAVHAWGNFVLDRSVPLGEDDRQAIYLVFAHYGLREASENLVLRKTDAGYFALDKVLASESAADPETTE